MNTVKKRTLNDIKKSVKIKRIASSNDKPFANVRNLNNNFKDLEIEVYKTIK